MTSLLEVDVTGVVLAGLRTVMTGRFVTETPADLTSAIAADGGVARVERSGGGDDGHRLVTATLTVECFAAGTEASRLFALRVVTGMYALRGLTVAGCTVTYVRNLGGPVPLPYANSSVRRQALTFRVAVKTA